MNHVERLANVVREVANLFRSGSMEQFYKNMDIKNKLKLTNNY